MAACYKVEMFLNFSSHILVTAWCCHTSELIFLLLMETLTEVDSILLTPVIYTSLLKFYIEFLNVNSYASDKVYTSCSN